MLFEKVTKEHILQGIQDFEEKGLPNEFGASSTYDVVYQGKKYPPKAIMAYANFYAEGRKIERYFKGGLHTDCFKAFERNGFNIQKKKDVMNENLYKLKQNFLDNWPIEQLEKMTLTDYTDTNRENSFCYWLEHITRDLGSIVGGSSYKFGIYKMGATSKTESATNRDNDGVYAWHTKYGSSANEAFETIKRLIINVANYSNNDELSLIDNIDLGDAFKWKIAFMYSDFQVVNTFKSDALKFIARKLYTNETLPENVGELNHFIISKNEDDVDYFEYTSNLWSYYDKYNSTEKEFKKWLNENVDKGSNKASSYLSAIKILINEFRIPIYTENDISVLEDLYEDLIQNQKDPNGKYVYKRKSYGEKGFYSAAIKTYIQFLNEDNNIVNEKTENYDRLLKTEYIMASNQILYGPPGTGKTYYLKEQLFDKYTLTEEAISKEKYFEDVITNLTWWQAITLALLEEGKSKVSEILANRWVATKANLSESKNVRATIWGTLQMHTIEESTSVNYKQRQAPLIFDKKSDKSWVLLATELNEQAPEIYNIQDEVNNFEASSGKIIKNYDFVTFHQSFAYEDFIEGIKPVLPENEEETADLGYQIEDGVFKKLCNRAKNDLGNRYAIFIDEINRGNVSAIFGELITLIELDKRKGEKNELTIKLPYSKKEFAVPSNIDIYGTMNTADRSVEALDTALRRRFEFKEMMPDYNVIANEEVNEIQLSEVLKTINDRIELLIDRDHTIGHSYFVGVDSPGKLANAFNNKIVPLLQEYFYGDYGKIGLVLGKGFVEKQKNDTIKFADFSYDNANDFITSSYTLKKVEKDTVVEAVQMLLSKTEIE